MTWVFLAHTYNAQVSQVWAAIRVSFG